MTGGFAVLRYHIALTVALALAPLAVGPAGEHGFITQFLAHWGGNARREATAQGEGMNPETQVAGPALTWISSESRKAAVC